MEESLCYKLAELAKQIHDMVQIIQQEWLRLLLCLSPPPHALGLT